MSIWQTLFSGAGNNQQQQTQQQTNQQQQQQQPANQHIQNNPTIPGGSADTSPIKKEESPNEKFKTLWDTSTTQQTNEAPNFKINQEQLKQITSGMDFTRSMNQEDLSKIAAGGQEAVVALGNIMNNFGRELFGLSAQFSSQMTESGYQSASRAIDAGLPNLVRKQLTEQELFNNNPKLKDPALQPLVGAMQSQFAAKHPNATPQELNALVNEYFSKVVTGAFTAPETAPVQKQDNSTNFSSFLP